MILFDYHVLQRYGGSVPRYTSYPPVPAWNGSPSREAWFESVARQSADAGGTSLYLHLPFCEKLCTYCACNKRITVNHSVEDPYIDHLLREWDAYRPLYPGAITLAELHLGGGTPSFFSASSLDRLLSELLKGTKAVQGASWSVEVHPGYTKREQLEVLYQHGFRRISIGVQSLAPQVQLAINRMQPLSQVEQVTRWAREIGYESVNFDLIYGLPFQGLAVSNKDVQQILTLRPDRVAHYGYAHVPWKHAGQRRYTEMDLPQGRERFESAQSARKQFLHAGYVEIGMDHYALPNDSLALAAKKGTLHRNFMGYTDQKPAQLIGLGASSISENQFAYVQNEKNIELYYDRIQEGKSTFIAGHTFTAEDRTMKAHILDLMCRMETSMPGNLNQTALESLGEMEAQGILTVSENKLLVAAHARPLLRSVCAVLDPGFVLGATGTYSQNL